MEIVPAQNPNRVLPGEALDVKVLYDGEPLPNASLMGGVAGGPAGEVMTVTDDNGRATVTLSSPGRWYLRSIHMVRLDDDPQVLWESFWCTLTFEIVEESR